MKAFSPAWKSSTRPAKQRKFRYNAPLHTRRAFVSAHLDAPLRKKHGIRSIPLRKGDKVKIMRGGFRGKTGAIDTVKVKIGKVYVSGISYTKKDGTTKQFPLDPSNLKITELNMEDKRRIKRNNNGKKSS